jgi:hypothetical protein
MQTRMIFAGLAAMSLLCSACDKRSVDTPVPQSQIGTVTPSGTPAATSDTSVPPAESVLSAASGAAKPAVDATRTNAKMTRAEESTAMPMAGQANDHSAPLLAKRASAP